MLLGGQDPGDAERRQRLGRARKRFNLEPDSGQLVGDLGGRRVGLEMVLQP
jgi:hypothetical protein